MWCADRSEKYWPSRGGCHAPLRCANCPLHVPSSPRSLSAQKLHVTLPLDQVLPYVQTPSGEAQHWSAAGAGQPLAAGVAVQRS